MNDRLRVGYVVGEYPDTSETYVKWEIDAAIRTGCVDVIVASVSPALVPYRDHANYFIESDIDVVSERFKEAGVDLIHSHYFVHARRAAAIAKRLGVPFTVRTHSFDVLLLDRTSLNGKQEENLDALADPACRLVLAFPFARSILEGIGVPSRKISEVFPVVNIPLFRDREPRPRGVMNTGADLPKKKMSDFVRLGSEVRDVPFRLYPLGMRDRSLIELNDTLGRPVEIHDPVEPEDMPLEYRRHDWLVYTASKHMNTVGWPIAIAEAQASGLGVCMARIRPDLELYGGGAVLFYDDIKEVVELVQAPPPDDLIAKGFEAAEKSNVHETIGALVDVWLGCA